ncbi:MAG: hypothetical protein SGPRY_008400 [Prymnesium sp.]
MHASARKFSSASLPRGDNASISSGLQLGRARAEREEAGEARKLMLTELSSLQRQVKELCSLSERHEDEIASLKSENTQLRGELKQLREGHSAAASEQAELAQGLQHVLEHKLGSLQAELASASKELGAMGSRVALLDAAQQATATATQEHSSQLKDVVVVRTQQSFTQQAIERSEGVAIESARMLSQLRGELAGLQQRHAGLASATAAEHSSHKEHFTALHASVEESLTRLQVRACVVPLFENHIACYLLLYLLMRTRYYSFSLAHQSAHLALIKALVQALDSRVSACASAAAASSQGNEKMKRASKRHELLLQRLTEVQEARAGRCPNCRSL